MTRKSQVEKFRAKARELGADPDTAKFNETLRRMAKGDKKAADEMADALGMADPSKDFGRKRRGN